MEILTEKGLKEALHFLETGDPDDDAEVNLVASRYTNCKILKQFGDGTTGLQSKLKDVTITIREDEASGNEVVTKTSTVIELE